MSDACGANQGNRTPSGVVAATTGPSGASGPEEMS
jgi:hypothetical protein